MDIQICKPHSLANLVIKGLIYLEARACFSVFQGFGHARPALFTVAPTALTVMSLMNVYGVRFLFMSWEGAQYASPRGPKMLKHRILRRGFRVGWGQIFCE